MGSLLSAKEYASTGVEKPPGVRNPGRTCTQVITLMYNPETGAVSLATDGCQAADLRKQGFTTDVPESARREYNADNPNQPMPVQKQEEPSSQFATLGVAALGVAALYLLQ